MLRASVLTLLAALGAGCGDINFFESISPGTAPNQCGNATTRATITGVEISDGDAFSSMARPFAALNEGDTVRIVRGFQGADMLVLSIRVSGLAMDACLPQRTDIFDATGARVSFNAQSISFVPTGGVATNERMFFPGNYTVGTVTIRTTVAGVTLTRTVMAARG
jgi:hypothetical protein